MMLWFLAAALLAVPATGAPAKAQAGAKADAMLVEAGPLAVEPGVARAAGPAARTGAGYLRVTNSGPDDDRLIAAESPAAERVELHAHLLDEGVARMVAVKAVDIPAGGTAELAQGGLHLMFMGLTEAWDMEGGVPVTLVFEAAGAVDIVLPVDQNPGAPDRGPDHGGGNEAHGPGPHGHERPGPHMHGPGERGHDANVPGGDTGGHGIGGHGTAGGGSGHGGAARK